MKPFYVMPVLVVFLSISATAQMLDTLSGLAVQGALANQSASSVAQGLSRLKQTQILQDLNRVALEIKISHMNGYTGLNAASVSGRPFEDVSWSVGPDAPNRFYIQLSDLDQATCRYLTTQMISAREIQINGVVGTSNQCVQQNTLRFIFD